MRQYRVGGGTIRERICELLWRRVVYEVLFLRWTCVQFATCQNTSEEMRYLCTSHYNEVVTVKVGKS